MPLKNRYRQYVQCIELETLVFDDYLALAADDQIDFVVKMPVRARTFARRNFRHHDTQSFAVKTDARIDNVRELAHRRRLENQILLLNQNLTVTPELLFVHG